MPGATVWGAAVAEGVAVACVPGVADGVADALGVGVGVWPALGVAVGVGVGVGVELLRPPKNVVLLPDDVESPNVSSPAVTTTAAIANAIRPVTSAMITLRRVKNPPPPSRSSS